MGKAPAPFRTILPPMALCKCLDPAYSPCAVILGRRPDDSRRLVAALANEMTPLAVFNGKSGILKSVADYAGYPKAHESRLFRQLLERLPTLIADVPFRKRNYLVKQMI